MQLYFNNKISYYKKIQSPMRKICIFLYIYLRLILSLISYAYFVSLVLGVYIRYFLCKTAVIVDLASH